MASLRIVLALAMLLQVLHGPCLATGLDSSPTDSEPSLSDGSIGSGNLDAIPPGAKIRIWAPSIARCRLLGTFVGRQDGAIMFRTKSGSPHGIPLSAISRLEVSRGQGARGTTALLGGAIGLFGGILLGAVATTAVVSGDMDDGVAVVGAGALLGGFVGGISGALAGAVMGRERWETVPASRFRLGISPLPRDGMVLTATLGF